MDKGPLFHAHVDGRQAAQEPAQQNLQQAEIIKQDQVRHQTMEQTQQQGQGLPDVGGWLLTELRRLRGVGIY
ncbi:hypothetical protein [Stenotrophomonas acidaminiphila]|uniref:hypothetical protein n=1 Tax=Stenotrophomonas acidaminiphila TaxID=128780 RepID=UPI0028AEAD0C|nr:hypothetical protein [Stenotrophomonas acidaminiphila]